MLEYHIYRLPSITGEGNTQMSFIINFNEFTVLCRLVYDIDDISDTFKHWICRMDIINENIDVPERSFVLNPDCLYYPDDELFSIAIRSDLSKIEYEDLQNVYLVIGVPVHE